MKDTLIKKKIKCSSYIRKFRMEQLQSYIWLTASSYIEKSLRISSYIRKPFLIYAFATAPLWVSIFMRKISFSFKLAYASWDVGESVTKSIHIFYYSFYNFQPWILDRILQKEHKIATMFKYNVKLYILPKRCFAFERLWVCSMFEWLYHTRETFYENKVEWARQEVPAKHTVHW